MNGIEIGIIDTRNIIRLINELYHYDFSDFALTSFKRRLENVISLYNLKFADNLLIKLREDKSFIDVFLHEIMVEPTEMFRDPSLWRLLRDEYLPQIAKNNPRFKVWFPIAVSGEELYSFLILIKEIGLTDSYEIIVSYFSEKSKAIIKSGRIKSDKIAVSKENYGRFHGTFKFENYYFIKNNEYFFTEELCKNVAFIHQDFTFENFPKSFDLIFFRNQLLYYNPGLQDRILDILFESLSYNGYLVAGIREKLSLTDTMKNLLVSDSNENIYQKK